MLSLSCPTQFYPAIEAVLNRCRRINDVCRQRLSFISILGMSIENNIIHTVLTEILVAKLFLRTL